MDGHHVFVAVEAGRSSSLLNWAGIRKEVSSGGGYLSLALLDGKKSNWVVRPTPSSDQIPLQVSTSTAGTAAPGIATAVVDQIMEAQGLVPGIKATEVRLYGGPLAESELNDALKGDGTIRLRVFDKGSLRGARSGRTSTFPSVAVAQPARVPASKPTVTGTGAGSPRPRAGTSTVGAKTSPAPVLPSPATPRALNGSFGSRYRPGRRVIAAVLTAAAVLLGVFPGWVWAHIWSYSYPSNAGVIADVISSVQSHAFGPSLVFGVLVALVGTRMRRLPLLGFGCGALVGVLPTIIPEFLVWTPPAPLYSFFVNTNGFWGEWTAWAPLIYIGIGLWLCNGASKTLPKTPQHVIDARKRLRQSSKDFLGRRSPIDKAVLAWLIGLALTGVGPWLLGRFVLQDNIMYTPSSDVINKNAREFWPYVPTLYLGGLAALLLVGGIAMVLQPWVGRIGSGLVGLALVAASLPVASFGTSLWQAQEDATAQRIMVTPFPFEDSFYTCGHAEASLLDASGRSWLYQVWSARIAASQVASDACNRVVIYQGWQRLRADDLPSGQTITAPPEFVSGQTSANAVFQYGTSDGSKAQVKVGQ